MSECWIPRLSICYSIFVNVKDKEVTYSPLWLDPPNGSIDFGFRYVSVRIDQFGSTLVRVKFS